MSITFIYLLKHITNDFSHVQPLVQLITRYYFMYIMYIMHYTIQYSIGTNLQIVWLDYWS